MSTSMPYTAGITVTPGNIDELRELGTAGCLVWDEGACWVLAVSGDKAQAPSRMIITGHWGLKHLARDLKEQGRPATDEELARDLTDIANDQLTDWPGIRAMNLQVQELREALIGPHIYLDAAPTFEIPAGGLPRMTDYYRRTHTGITACVTVTFGYLEPTRITVCTPGEVPRPVADLTVSTAGPCKAHQVHRLIAAAVDGALDLDL
ncbi:hypothetical protein ACOQFV_30640 [Nocardiopsis changdeensis]|uniref:Uncharacterized protein n=1 Tax=Nocardiopsis changdeensis TaxID=2831969 RepID=A0ABX8BQ36_9ACTN|nr:MULTISPECIES: hypothetical protein [Nocardiopsis]QUX24162.1 hypothetical protein KGD84_07625 [Nocardiopsis changdeensis]QYX34557.1 hypothetical protein K1J57_17085 [Nocardiopsis sp. MT53]